MSKMFAKGVGVEGCDLAFVSLLCWIGRASIHHSAYVHGSARPSTKSRETSDVP